MKKLFGALIVILALVGTAAYVGLNYGTVPMSGYSGSCIGFNDIALSSVDYLSNDPVIGGQSWVLTVVQNCQGRYAVGTFDKSTMVDNQDGAKTEYDLKITTSLDEQKCVYPIQIEGTPIYNMNKESRELWLGWGSGEWQTECLNKPGAVMFGKLAYSWEYTCFWVSEKAKHGLIGTSSTTFKSTIKLESHGETKTATITNTGPGSAPIGDIGTAYWNGNLVTGDQCPSASDYRVSAAYRNGAWITIDESKYQDYKNHISAGFENCVNRYIEYGTETAQSCVDNYNVYANNALSGKQLISIGGTAGETRGSTYNGQVVLEPTKLLQYPMITMRLNVDWLGLFIPVGEPKVVHTSSQPFRTGTTGIINVQVQNVGSGTGAFNVYVTCPSPFTQQGTSQQVTLAPNEITTVSIPISASADQEYTKTCTAYAQDRNDPTRKDSMDISVTVKPQVVCTPNERRCNGNYIEMCDTQGTGWTFIQECVLGCEIKNSVPTCKSQVQPICGNGVCETGETYLTCSKDCGTPTNCGNGVCDPGEDAQTCPNDCGFGFDTNTLGIIALVTVIALFGVVVYRQKKGKGRSRHVRQ